MPLSAFSQTAILVEVSEFAVYRCVFGGDCFVGSLDIAVFGIIPIGSEGSKLSDVHYPADLVSSWSVRILLERGDPMAQLVWRWSCQR